MHTSVASLQTLESPPCGSEGDTLWISGEDLESSVDGGLIASFLPQTGQTASMSDATSRVSRMDPEPSITSVLSTSAPSIDPLKEIANERRRPYPERAWVMTNMIASLDGATAVDGLSGPLGGPADLAVFVALRAVADLIVVGATTASAEAYKPPAPSAAIQAMRAERGQAKRPTVVVVSRSLSLDPAEPLFSEPGHRPIVLTVENAPPDRAERLAKVAEIVTAGSGDVDLPAGLTALRRRGDVILLEGGPTLNGQFIAADLVDEWNQTIAPLLASGQSRRPASGPAPATPSTLELSRLWTADNLLFGRWVRTGQGSAPG